MLHDLEALSRPAENSPQATTAPELGPAQEPEDDGTVGAFGKAAGAPRKEPKIADATPAQPPQPEPEDEETVGIFARSEKPKPKASEKQKPKASEKPKPTARLTEKSRKTPFGRINVPMRDVAYSFTCEHCGANSGWLICRAKSAGLERMVEKGQYPFPEKCPRCGEKQSWGTKAVLRKALNKWIYIASFFSVCYLIPSLDTINDPTGSDLTFPFVLLGIVMFFAMFSPFYLIPLAVRKIRDSRVTKREKPSIRWVVNYVLDKDSTRASRDD